jgi:hypothetical protein
MIYCTYHVLIHAIIPFDQLKLQRAGTKSIPSSLSLRIQPSGGDDDAPQHGTRDLAIDLVHSYQAGAGLGEIKATESTRSGCSMAMG